MILNTLFRLRLKDKPYLFKHAVLKKNQIVIKNIEPLTISLEVFLCTLDCY